MARGPNIRSMTLDFWRRFWWDLDLRRAVSVEHRSGEETRVEVEDRLPHLLPRGAGPARYRVTTRRRRMETDRFPDGDLRGRIGRAAAKARHRALFCVDLRTEEVVCALCFHVDEDPRLPVHLRELALSEADDRHDRALSRFCGTLLLAYLAEVGSVDHRGRRVGFLAEGDAREELAAQFGFRPAQRPASVAGPGTYMLMEPPPRLPKR